jgi:hypothetical protein
MRPTIARHGFPRVSPAWLRPGALCLAVLLHLIVFFGIQPLERIKSVMPSPVQIELAALGEPARPSDTHAAPTEILEQTPLQATPASTTQNLDPVAMTPSSHIISSAQMSSASVAAFLADAPDRVEIKSSAPRNPQNVAIREQQLAELDSLERAPTSANLVASAAEVQTPIPDTPAHGRQQTDTSSLARPLANAIDRQSISPNLVQKESKPLYSPASTSNLPSDRAPAFAAGFPQQLVLGPAAVTIPEFEPLGRAPTSLLELTHSAVSSFATDASARDQIAISPNLVATSPPINPLTDTSILPRDSGPAFAARLPGQSGPGPSSVVIPALAPLDRASTGLLSLAPPDLAVPSPATHAPLKPSLSGLQATRTEPSILQDQRTNRPEGVDRIIRYLQRYDGGPCFFVAPVEVSETVTKLEGYGESPKPFEDLDAAFLHENGYEASIDVRLVTPAQCPAVRLLSRLRGPFAPHLQIDATRLRPGAPLTGSLDAPEGRSIELLLVTNTGAVRNISQLLRPGASGRTFMLDLADLDGASFGQPQLLIAVASAHPLAVLRFDGRMAADWLLSSVLAETARIEPVFAMARYFKLER